MVTYKALTSQPSNNQTIGCDRCLI